MALTGTLQKRHKTGGLMQAVITVVASGSYSTGGDALDIPVIVGLTDRKPDHVFVSGIAGFVYQYDLANEKLFVYTNTAGGANAALGEHTAAAYAAGVTGDTITAIAFWVMTPKLN